jgi:hypothetical protein
VTLRVVPMGEVSGARRSGTAPAPGYLSRNAVCVAVVVSGFSPTAFFFPAARLPPRLPRSHMARFAAPGGPAGLLTGVWGLEGQPGPGNALFGNFGDTGMSGG